MNEIVLTPTADLSVVAQAPRCTRFIFEQGVYRLFSATPKDGQVFHGEPGAVLSGAKVLTGWTQQNNGLWVVTGQTQYQPDLIGAPGDTSQHVHAEDLYFDGQPLIPVANLAQIQPGKWFFDYANQAIYCMDDPTKHLVETSVTASAFSPWNVMPKDVRIEGLSIVRYATPAQYGTIGSQYPAPDWYIDGCDIGWNHGAGVNLGPGSIVSNSRIHDNGNIGVVGGGHGLVIYENDIYGNNWANFDPAWSAGGIKLSQAQKPDVIRNRVFKNNGAGIWFDVNTVGAKAERNRVEKNLTGISYEIGWGGLVRDNDCAYNRDSQILIAATRDVIVELNRVDFVFQSAGIVQDDRVPRQSFYGWWTNEGIVVRNNWVNGVFRP